MSRVESYAASNLRYVGEAKLARLSDADLVELHKLLKYKLGEVPMELPADKPATIKAILDLKVRIGIISKAEADAVSEVVVPPSGSTAQEPPHEEHDAQGTNGNDALAYARDEFEKMFAKEIVDENVDANEQAAQDEANRARANAFVQLVAAASSPPEPEPAPEAPLEAAAEEEVVVEKHRLRVCSFNALKLRLGNANKNYFQSSVTQESEEYEGTQKGAELTQKWLTLSAIMADFDVIMLQEVPGSEKLLDERMSTFARMLQLATPACVEWTALPSEKSGKDGKVVGPGAECHVCFVKSPVKLVKFDTLRKAGVTMLDYAPLQVALHDPRFEDPLDRDFVVTSVHMPPSPRVDARDSQIAALLRSYAAPDTSEYRLQMPWGPSKEAKLAPVHLVVGDFNAYPGQDEYKMAENGFINKIPQKAATTVGHKHYDNVLVNKDADERFLIGGGILQLKGASEDAKTNLSDHWPVFVEVVEVKKVGSDRAPPAPKADAAPEAPEPHPPPEPPGTPPAEPTEEAAPEPTPEPAPEPASEPTHQMVEVPLLESTPESEAEAETETESPAAPPPATADPAPTPETDVQPEATPAPPEAGASTPEEEERSRPPEAETAASLEESLALALDELEAMPAQCSPPLRPKTPSPLLEALREEEEGLWQALPPLEGALPETLPLPSPEAD